VTQQTTISRRALFENLSSSSEADESDQEESSENELITEEDLELWSEG